MSLPAETIKKVFKDHGGSEKNTGSIEAQIALFTKRISHITDHLKNNKKDVASSRALVQLVAKRKSLLKYLSHKDIERYRKVIEKLKLRK